MKALVVSAFFVVFIIDGCSFHFAHTWSKSGISVCWRHLVTSKESSNPILFFGKRPCLHHTCATWNEQQSNIKTRNCTHYCSSYYLLSGVYLSTRLESWRTADCEHWYTKPSFSEKSYQFNKIIVFFWWNSCDAYELKKICWKVSCKSVFLANF